MLTNYYDDPIRLEPEFDDDGYDDDFDVDEDYDDDYDDD